MSQSSEMGAMKSIPKGGMRIIGLAFALASSLFADYQCKAEAIVIPDDVTSIGDYEFYELSWLTSVMIPPSVTNIGSSAFESCSALMDVKFLGDAPVAWFGIYDDTPSVLVTYVKEGSLGWNDDATSDALPETWQERAIVSYTSPSSVFSRIIYANLKDASHSNLPVYQEGKGLQHSAPTSSVRGYTFAAWTQYSRESPSEASESANASIA